MDLRKAFLYFDPRVFVLVRLSTPSQIALNRILWFIDQYPYHPRNWIVYRFEIFCGGPLKLENLRDLAKEYHKENF